MYMLALAHHVDYRHYDLDMGHPLLGNKPQATYEYLNRSALRDSIAHFEPSPAKERDLLRVHTKPFVVRVKRLGQEGGLLSRDTPAARDSASGNT